MNKLRLPALLLLLSLAVFTLHSCNKDAVTSTAFSNAPFQANINGVVWTPDTVNSTISFNSTGSYKSFYCIGTKGGKRVSFSVKVNTDSNTPGFPIGSYNIDATDVKALYEIQEKDEHGNYVFVQHGTVEPGAGNITVTAVDSVKQQITGTFGFYSRTTNYDGDGNVISITVDNITGGVFTSQPYTFSNNDGLATSHHLNTPARK